MTSFGSCWSPSATLMAVCALCATVAGCPVDPVVDDDDDGTPPADPAAIDVDRMWDDLSELASDAFGGRAPATEGNDLALDLVEATFDEIGLTPSGDDGGFRQAFPISRWEQLAPSSVNLGGQMLAEGQDYRVFTYTGGATVDAELVFAGYGLTIPAYDPADYPDCPFDDAGYDDYDGVNVAGAIALVLRRGHGGDEDLGDVCPAAAPAMADDELLTFGVKAANARAHSAAAMVLIQDYAHGNTVVEGALDLDYYDEAFVALSVDRDVVEAAVPQLPGWVTVIDETLTPGGQPTGITAALDVSAAISEYDVDNLIGVIPGTDPDLAHEVIVIGAHLDHLGTDDATGDIYNGADDNASGTTVMLELARAFAVEGLQPARTLMFAAYNAEELGLIGSCHYAGHPSYPLEDHVVMISVDMVGAGDAAGLYLYGGLVEEYQWLGELMDQAAWEQDLPYVVENSIPVMASDHVCFIAGGGVAVLAETTGPHEVYHTPDDDLDHVSADNLETAAELLRVTLLPLARGTERNYVDVP